MNLIHCEVLIKEHTQLQQARVCEFLRPRPVVVTHNCDYAAGREAPPQES